MKCYCCNNEKLESEFDWKQKERGIRQSKCKACRKEYSKQHYKLNEHAYKHRARINNPKIAKRNKDFIAAQRKGKSCIECGNSHPAVLDFHHTHDKLTEVSNMYFQSIESIREEINKCVVLCSNCHRIHHWKLIH